MNLFCQGLRILKALCRFCFVSFVEWLRGIGAKESRYE